MSRRGRLLHVAFWLACGIGLAEGLTTASSSFLLLGVGGAGLLATRLGAWRTASFALVGTLMALSLRDLVGPGPADLPSAALTFLVGVLFAGQLLGSQAALWVTVVGVASVLGLLVASDFLPWDEHQARRGGAMVRGVTWLAALGGFVALSAREVERLRERVRREQRARAELIERSPDGMVSLDAEGCVLLANAALEKLGGVDRTELIGQPWEAFDRLAPEDREHARSLVTRTLGGESLEREPLTIRRADGSSAHLEVGTWRVERPDGTPGVDMVLRDVSDRARAGERGQTLERQAASAQRLEAVGQLAGGVAHDFNNLLTSILGNSELMLDDDLTEDQRTGVQEIQQSARRAAQLTSQLLAFARKRPAAARTVAVNELVTALAPILGRLVQEHSRLDLELGSGLPLVFEDPNQIDQALVGLVAAARDAAPRASIFTISTRTVSFASPQPDRPAGAYVEIAVTHDGVETGGSPPASLLLPAAPGAAATAPESYLTRTLEAQTVLLVDDDDSVRKANQRGLTRAGHLVLGASSAEEALRMFEQAGGKVTVLVTDVAMPTMSGVALAERLRSTRPELPVLFMTGYADPRLLPDPGTGSRFAILQKPFTPSHLCGKLAEFLGELGKTPAPAARTALGA